MELGAFVDYCDAWSKVHETEEDGEGKKKPTKRKATQADWNALMG